MIFVPYNYKYGLINTINYEYDSHMIHCEYDTNTYDSQIIRYNTITIHYDQNHNVIVLGQPYIEPALVVEGE